MQTREVLSGSAHLDSIAVSDQGRVALAASSLTGDLWDGSVVLVAGDAVTGTMPTKAGVTDVAWLGAEILVAGDDLGNLTAWQLPSAEVAVEPMLELGEHQEGVTCLASSRGTLRVASASADGTARVWMAVQGSSGSHVLQHTSNLASWRKCPVHTVTWLPEPEGLATGASDGVLRLWDLRASQPLVGRSSPVDAPLLAAAVGSAESQLLTGCEAGRVMLFDRRRLATPIATDQVGCLAAHAPTELPHRTCSSRGRSRSVHRHFRALQVHQAAVTSLALSSGDAPMLATSSEDHSAALLDPRDLACTTRVTEHTDFVRCAAWAPAAASGGRPGLLTAGWDKRLLHHDLD